MSDSEQPPTAGHNGIHGNGTELQRYVDAIMGEHDRLDVLRSEYMTACKGPRSRMRETMKAAKEAGVSMVAFREVITTKLFDRKQAKRVEEFEADDQTAFEKMLDALGEFGDTPLGSAALNRAKQNDQALAGITQG